MKKIFLGIGALAILGAVVYLPQKVKSASSSDVITLNQTIVPPQFNKATVLNIELQTSVDVKTLVVSIEEIDVEIQIGDNIKHIHLIGNDLSTLSPGDLTNLPTILKNKIDENGKIIP